MLIISYLVPFLNVMSIWYLGQKKKNGLKPIFQQYQNWPMRGLFWLSKDLYEDKNEFREFLEPEAQELAEIRNQLEHKYLKIHDECFSKSSSPDDISHDKLAYSIYRKEFEDRTLKLIKMVRSALIYLSLAITSEEQIRKMKINNKIIPGIHLDIWKDNWKV